MYALLLRAACILAVKGFEPIRNSVQGAFRFPLFHYRAPPDELPYELVQILARKTEELAYLPARGDLLFLQVRQDLIFRSHNFIMVHPGDLSTAKDLKIHGFLKKPGREAGGEGRQMEGLALR